MVVQLLLIGFVLEWLFTQDNALVVVAIALGIFGVVLLAYRRLLSPDHQLRLDYLVKQ